MPEFDWRSPETYRPIQDVNAAGFAWEFLRRNPDYRRDVKKLAGKPAASIKVGDAFARHWGLPFRDGPKPLRCRNTGVLASNGDALCHSPHRGTRTFFGGAPA